MSFVNDLLKKNPKVLSKYVALVSTLVDKAVTPLNKLMVHLLEVQGIDPKTQPGERARKALVNAFDQFKDTEDFEAGFNFSPALKAFEKTGAKLQHLNLTKEQFKKATDLSDLSDPVQLKSELQVKSALVDALPYPPQSDYENHLDELKSFMDKYHMSTTEIPLNTASVKDALKTLQKYANKFAPTERVEDSRAPQIVGRVRRSAQPVTVTKAFKKGVFRRTNKEE